MSGVASAAPSCSILSRAVYSGAPEPFKDASSSLFRPVWFIAAMLGSRSLLMVGLGLSSHRLMCLSYSSWPSGLSCGAKQQRDYAPVGAAWQAGLALTGPRAIDPSLTVAPAPTLLPSPGTGLPRPRPHTHHWPSLSSALSPGPSHPGHQAVASHSPGLCSPVLALAAAHPELPGHAVASHHLLEHPSCPFTVSLSFFPYSMPEGGWINPSPLSAYYIWPRPLLLLLEQ